jgi:hypothetical protein
MPSNESPRRRSTGAKSAHSSDVASTDTTGTPIRCAAPAADEVQRIEGVRAIGVGDGRADRLLPRGRRHAEARDGGRHRRHQPERRRVRHPTRHQGGPVCVGAVRDRALHHLDHDPLSPMTGRDAGDSRHPHQGPRQPRQIEHPRRAESERDERIAVERERDVAQPRQRLLEIGGVRVAIGSGEQREDPFAQLHRHRAGIDDLDPHRGRAGR